MLDHDTNRNYISLHTISFLKLEVETHPSPYVMHKDQDDDVTVLQMCLVSFKIGELQNNVWCHIIDIRFTHVLLGKPWMQWWKSTYDDQNNKYNFIYKKIKVALNRWIKKIIRKLVLRRFMEYRCSHWRSFTSSSESSPTDFSPPPCNDLPPVDCLLLMCPLWTCLQRCLILSHHLTCLLCQLQTCPLWTFIQRCLLTCHLKICLLDFWIRSLIICGSWWQHLLSSPEGHHLHSTKLHKSDTVQWS